MTRHTETIEVITRDGYRRAGALLNRERRSQGQQALNHKRIYRVMARHRLLLPKAPKRRHSSRVHDG